MKRQCSLQLAGHVRRWIGGFCLFILLAACARLPEYALPKEMSVDTREALAAEGIQYRSLTISDFRAEHPPQTSDEDTQHLGAKIVTHIRGAERLKFQIEAKSQDIGYMYYGRIENIAFEAVMLPDYSWWSPKVSPLIRAYVLQHEQVHFAISELHARELSRDARKQLENFVVSDTSRGQVERQLKNKVAALVQTARKREMAQQLKFDMETSLYFDPETLQQWYDTLTSELQSLDNG